MSEIGDLLQRLVTIMEGSAEADRRLAHGLGLLRDMSEAQERRLDKLEAASHSHGIRPALTLSMSAEESPTLPMTLAGKEPPAIPLT